MMHLTPALPPSRFADYAGRGEGETPPPRPMVGEHWFVQFLTQALKAHDWRHEGAFTQAAFFNFTIRSEGMPWARLDRTKESSV